MEKKGGAVISLTHSEVALCLPDAPVEPPYGQWPGRVVDERDTNLESWPDEGRKGIGRCKLLWMILLLSGGWRSGAPGKGK